jgi:hypothetical protein
LHVGVDEGVREKSGSQKIGKADNGTVAPAGGNSGTVAPTGGVVQPPWAAVCPPPVGGLEQPPWMAVTINTKTKPLFLPKLRPYY